MIFSKKKLQPQRQNHQLTSDHHGTHAKSATRKPAMLALLGLYFAAGMATATATQATATQTTSTQASKVSATGILAMPSTDLSGCTKVACDVTVSHWLFTNSTEGAGQLPSTDANWQLVRVPHTPVLEPLVVNNQWQGTAWYKTTLKLTALEQQQLWLHFAGAMNIADVYLNGQHLRQHIGGYLPFAVDLTKFAKTGDNELLVRLDNRDNAITGPKPLAQLDFNFFGGLYRQVVLQRRPPVHFGNDLLAAQGQQALFTLQNRQISAIDISYPQLDAEQASIALNTGLNNSAAQSQTVEIEQQLFDGQQLVAQSRSKARLAAKQQVAVAQQLRLKSPKLWSPSSPALYRLQTTIWQGKQQLEQQTRRIGLRTLAFNAQQQLLLNGKVTHLRGVNRHQEFPHVGYASSAQADYRDAVRIKGAGFDYVRLSHYPQSEAFMDAADELGLLLLDAVPGWQYYSADPAFSAYIVQSCAELVRRSRHRPSILAFECSLNETAMPESLISALHQTVKQHAPAAYSAGWTHGFDIYLQARQHRLQHYTPPTQPYIVSEYGDWEYYAQDAGFAQHQWNSLKPAERTSRQLLSAGEKPLLQQARNLQEAHNDNFSTPAFADGYWVMFDYNRGYADDLEASGIMSINRLPKYSYYFFQSQRPASEQNPAYPSGPMVFIASDWTVDSSLQVRVFSNAEQVELWRNDELIARQAPDQDQFSDKLNIKDGQPPFSFNLDKFVAGTLTAKAFINGKQVATHQVKTPGKPSQLRLRVETAASNITAFDQVFVYAEVLDDAGNLVAVQHLPVQFKTSGDGLQLLNPQTPLTERGVAAMLVEVGSAGRIEVSAEGLRGDSLNLAAESGTDLAPNKAADTATERSTKH